MHSYSLTYLTLLLTPFHHPGLFPSLTLFGKQVAYKHDSPLPLRADKMTSQPADVQDNMNRVNTLCVAYHYAISLSAISLLCILFRMETTDRSGLK